MSETTLVRRNLMEREDYTPYCGNHLCPDSPRTFFNGRQFRCRTCAWVSEFPEDFIARYIDKLNGFPIETGSDYDPTARDETFITLK